MKLRDQKGVLTIDFIFSFTMVIGLFQLFYVVSYTLMVAQLTQYITFASARVYFAAHIDERSQIALAEKKYNELVNNSAVANFFKSGFALTNFEARYFDEIDVQDAFRQKFIGVRVNFESKILDFNVPFLGRTSSELDTNGFKADIGSFLYREPSSSECFEFMRGRARAILQLQNKYSQATSHGFDSENIAVFADNGC